MAKRPWVELSRAPRSVRVHAVRAEGAGSCAASGEPAAGGATGAVAGREREGLSSATKALVSAAHQLAGLIAEVRAAAEEELAELAVLIAEKILGREIEGGGYEIRSIVSRVLSEVPVKEDVTVRLHPGDLAACQRLWAETGDLEESALSARLVGDPSLGRGECVVETAAGSAEAMVASQLAMVREAFKDGG